MGKMFLTCVLLFLLLGTHAHAIVHPIGKEDDAQGLQEKITKPQALTCVACRSMEATEMLISTLLKNPLSVERIVKQVNNAAKKKMCTFFVGVEVQNITWIKKRVLMKTISVSFYEVILESGKKYFVWASTKSD